MAGTNLEGGSNTSDNKDLQKILKFKKASFFFVQQKNINANVRKIHLGFIGTTPTINTLELHYRTFLQTMAIYKHKSIITTTEECVRQILDGLNL
jgi:hypothetical protein